MGRLISLPPDFPVRMYPKSDRERESEGSVPAYSPKSSDLLATYHPSGCYWKTSQVSLTGELGTFSGRWPTSGMTQCGTAYRLPQWERLTAGRGSGLLPTPSANDWKGSSNHGQRRGQLSERCIGQKVNPVYLEWMMGYPDGWTE